MSRSRMLASALLAALALPAAAVAHKGDDRRAPERDDRHPGAVAVAATPASAQGQAPALAATAQPAAVTPAAAGVGPPPDAVAPAPRAVRVTLHRGRHAGLLRVTLSEDARLEIDMRSLGHASDLVPTRRLTLYARAGTSTVRLPTMNLSARRYRLRIVAVDQAGNRSPALGLLVRTGGP